MFAKHKNKLIAAIVVVAVLTGAWFFGGNYDRGQEQRAESAQDLGTRTQDLEETGDAREQGSGAGDQESGDGGAQGAGIRGQGSGDGGAQGSGARDQGSGDGGAQGSEVRDQESGDGGAQAADAAAGPETTDSSGASEPNDSSAAEASSENGDTAAETPAKSGAGVTEGSGVAVSETQENTASVSVPEENPPPVEPEDAAAGDGSFTVTLCVRCDTILGNMELLSKEKWELVPADGVVFAKTAVTAYEGESVFNVVLREMKQARIHFTFRNTPIYNSAYIEAFNNLYEFDAGELAGWMYCVNGRFPNYGCSRYQLEPGDVIEWNYTCDLGRDLGWTAGGWQIDD